MRGLSATPDAGAYDARFQPYVPPSSRMLAYTVTELIGNSVVRWEYRPGSTLFVVWQHGRSGFSDPDLGRPWSREYRELFDLHPDNAFLIKRAYWMSR